MAPYLYTALKNWLPQLHILNTYGLTEATSPAVITPIDWADQKIGSIGVPSPVTQIKIVDFETNQELGPNKPGELLLRSPLIIPFYWENQEGTKKAFMNGWFRTGDTVYQDEDGFLYLLDRVKDMINCGGEKVYSAEVENVLCSHPAILEAAVIPLKDDKYGEVVKALVVLRAGMNLTPDEVIDWVRLHLAKYKVPRVVDFVDQLPRNAAGKVTKHALCEH